MPNPWDRREFLRATAMSAAAIAAFGFRSAPGAAVTAPAGGKPRIPGTGSAYFGAYRPGSVAGCSSPLDLETMVGHTFGINHHFRSPPDSPWAPLRDHLRADQHAGRISMLSYAAGKASGYADERTAALVRLTEIARGERDAYLDGQARALAALGTPAFLRFAWECDIRYAGTFGANAYRAAWRRVHSRFRLQGATNVAFVWCPTWLAFQDVTAGRYYPGDQYVDWIAADGYARYPDYRSFSALFTAANLFALRRGKPFMVAETGVHRLTRQDRITSGSTEQSAWLDDVRHLLTSGRFANLKALVYFHMDGDNVPQPNSWRVTVPNPGPALRSFESLASTPRLRAVAARPAVTAPQPAELGVRLSRVI
jgi:hypothetical protein